MSAQEELKIEINLVNVGELNTSIAKIGGVKVLVGACLGFLQ